MITLFTTLISFLTGIENKMIFENGPMAGQIFENYIVSEILVKRNMKIEMLSPLLKLKQIHN